MRFKFEGKEALELMKEINREKEYGRVIIKDGDSDLFNGTPKDLIKEMKKINKAYDNALPEEKGAVPMSKRKVLDYFENIEKNECVLVLEGSSLRTFVKNMNRHRDTAVTKIFVGSGSGYFFVGTPETFINDMEKINEAFMDVPQKKKKQADDADSCAEIPLKDRTVLNFFERIQHDGHAIVIEGSEVGSFWTENEYLEALKGNEGNYREILKGRHPH